jgi:hypothetical protein
MFFNDLWDYGIPNITPTIVMEESWSGTVQYANFAYPNTPGCPQGTKYLGYFPWLPYGLDPSSNLGADRTNDNQAYVCSPIIPSPYFWGWDKLWNLVNQIAFTARHSGPAGFNGLSIEELDLQNEVNLEANTVEARLIYDNTPGRPTAVFDYIGGALAANGYTASVATVSAVTPHGPTADYLNAGGHLASPCNTLFGDPAQVMPTVELLSAIGGWYIGGPPFVTWRGDLGCDDSLNHCPDPGVNYSGWFQCATGDMVQVPVAQQPRTVTDMHASPCIQTFVGPPETGHYECITSSTGPDISGVAQDHFDAVQSFLDLRAPNNTVIFGETWSNSPPGYTCDLPPGNPDGTQRMAQQTVNGYSSASSRLKSISGSRVAFRPWENALASDVCVTPAQIGAPYGPYKR